MSNSDPALAKKAAAWFARCHSPDATDATHVALKAWLAAAPENRQAFVAVERVWTAAPILLAALSPADLLAGQTAQPRTRYLPDLSKLAAALLVAAGLGAAIYFAVRPQAPHPMIVAAASTPQAAVHESVYATDSRNCSSIALPDGSLAVLSPDSEVRVAYSEKARTVRLARGQALFEVAKHKPQPFFVLAGDRRVMATGTAFDVRVAGARKLVEVTLVEGSVVVEQTAGRSRPVQMNAGQRLLVRDGMTPELSRGNFEDVINWRTERLTFYEAPLSAVVSTLNRYGGPAIRLKSDALGELKVDGTLRTNDPVSAAEAIAEIYKLHMTRHDGAVVLSQ